MRRFGDAFLACVLHALGIALYTSTRLGSSWGFDMTYLTHWFVAATLVVVIVLAVTTAISQLMYASFCFRGQWIECGRVAPVEWTTALALVALVSMQLLLTIASLGIVSGYDGSLFGDHRSWTQTSFEWAGQHTVSFFFAAALVGGRYECQNPSIPRRLLRVVYFGVPGVLILGWIITMLASGQPIHYLETTDVTALGVATVAALVPWIVVGVVVC